MEKNRHGESSPHIHRGFPFGPFLRRVRCASRCLPLAVILHGIFVTFKLFTSPLPSRTRNPSPLPPPQIQITRVASRKIASELKCVWQEGAPMKRRLPDSQPIVGREGWLRFESAGLVFLAVFLHMLTRGPLAYCTTPRERLKKRVHSGRRTDLL